MRRRVLSALLAPSLVATCAASPRLENPSDDRYLMGRLEKILEFEQTGKRIPWLNPKTGNGGTIVIQRTFFKDPGTPCREFGYTLDTGFLQWKDFSGTACRSSIGGWYLESEVDLPSLARNRNRENADVSDALVAFGVDDAALDDPPVELRLDDQALRDFGPAARRADGTRLERLDFVKEPGEGAAPALPSGAPLAAGIAVPPLASSTGSPLSCAAAAPLGPAVEVTELDLVIVLDTTSSMKREFEAIQSAVLSSVRLLRRMVAGLNVGFVAYRDRADACTTRAFQLAPMTADKLQRLSLFVMGLRAAGGGDVPEAVDEALEVA